MRRMLCIGLLLATLTIAASVRAETITIRADEWLPYNGPSTLRPAGYMIDLAMRIAKDHGHTIDYRHLPWDDALAAVKKGEFDCVVGANEEEAEGMVLPGLSWGSSQNVAYTLEGSKQVIGSIEAIKAKRLIYIPGYSYGEELDPWIEQNAGNRHRPDSGQQPVGTLTAQANQGERCVGAGNQQKNRAVVQHLEHPFGFRLRQGVIQR